MRVAVFDIGKTNAKLALVDTGAARELELRSRPTPMIDGPLYRSPDIEALWTFLLESLKALGEREPIDAIGITAHGATVALLDADGELALPVLDYEHEGPEDCAADYDAVRPPFAETGSPRLPGGLNVGAQLFWQERRFPERFARVAHVLTWPQYWAWRLSGELASDATSLGCHTDLFVPTGGTFSSLARTRDWERLLPPVRRSGVRLGRVTAEVAARTGLRPDTPVHVGIHDSNASLVPHLLAEDTPRAVVSTGTWVIVMALGAAMPTLDPARDTLVNVDARGAPVPSARFMGGREHTLLSRTAAANGAQERAPAPAPLEPSGSRSAESEDERALARVLDEGAMLLPAVVRGSGPFPTREASWTVPEDALDDAARAIVVAHYLAMMTVTCLELVGARGPIAVEGPFGANRHYVRMLGAATGRPVETGLAATGTSVGTAMLIEAPRSAPLRMVDEIPRPWRARLSRHAALWRERVI